MTRYPRICERDRCVENAYSVVSKCANSECLTWGDRSAALHDCSVSRNSILSVFYNVTVVKHVPDRGPWICNEQVTVRRSAERGSNALG